MSTTALNRISTRLKPAEPSRLLLGIGAAAIMVGLIVAHAEWLFLAALAGFVVSLFWPVQIALGVFGLLVPFDNIAVLNSSKSGTTLTYLVGAGAAVILLTTGLAAKRLAKPPRPALWWTAFVLWSTATVLWSLDVHVALRRLPTVFALLLLYLVAVSVRVTKRELRTIVLLITLGGCIAGAYAILQYRHGVYYHNSVRASLNTGERETDPNGFAASLMLPISLAIGGFLSSQRRFEKTLMLGAMGIMGLAVFLTESRGGLLALGVLVLVFLIRYRVRMRTVILVCVLVTAPTFVVSSLSHRWSTAVSSGGAGRLYIWQVGAIIIRHHGILGVGLANFPVAYNLYPGRAPVFERYGRGSHSIYLSTWAETGILGLLLLFAAIRSDLRIVSKITKGMAGSSALVPYEAACWAMLVVGTFLDVIYKKDFWLLWILLPIAIRVWTEERRNISRDGTSPFRDLS